MLSTTAKSSEKGICAIKRGIVKLRGKETMTLPEETKKYSTRSIDCAATLMSLGARIVGVKREKEDEKFLTFMFEAEFDMEKTSLQLVSRTLVGNIYDVLEANKRMKSIIHSSPR